MTKEIPITNVQDRPLVQWRIRRSALAAPRLRKRTGLKGRHNKAQGNALGIAPPNSPALKGRNRPLSFEPRRSGEDFIQPLQGFVSETGFTPRALPWALLWLPLRGAEPECPEAVYNDEVRAESEFIPSV